MRLALNRDTQAPTTRPAFGTTIALIDGNGETAMAEATLASKGRVALPREVREHLGLQVGDRVAFSLLSDRIVIVRGKTRQLTNLAGILKRPDKPNVPIEQMNPFR